MQILIYIYNNNMRSSTALAAFRISTANILCPASLHPSVLYPPSSVGFRPSSFLVVSLFLVVRGDPIQDLLWPPLFSHSLDMTIPYKSLFFNGRYYIVVHLHDFPYLFISDVVQFRDSCTSSPEIHFKGQQSSLVLFPQFPCFRAIR